MNRSMLKELKVEDAIGYTLAHDLTKIVPGEFKGRIFKKGHIKGRYNTLGIWRVL